MNMSTQSLESLNALVDVKTPASYGATSSITGLKAINAFLEASFIPADELTCSNGQALHPLEGHILLGGSHLLQLHLDKLWLDLQGGGIHSIHTFGDLENEPAYLRAVGGFKDAGLVRNMRTVDKMPADTAERIILCLRLLGSSSGASTMPLPYTSVQRHLSEILLTYPALMHPRVLVPVVRGDATEYMSILHAVAATGAGLPRRSHFLAGTGGLRMPIAGTSSEIEKLDDRLHAFARHPCVRFSFKRQSCIHVQASSVKNGTSKRDIVAKSTRLAEFAFGTGGPKVQFMASVMELDELVVRRSTDALGQSVGNDLLPLPMNFMAPALVSVPHAAAAAGPAPRNSASFDVNSPEHGAAVARELETTLILNALAASIYAASGLIHTPTSVSTTAVLALPGIGDANDFESLEPDDLHGDGDEAGPWRRFPKDTAFLECIAKRSELLSTHPEFKQRVEQIMSRRVFLGRFDELCPADVRTNAQRTVAGLLRSGLVSSPADAGKLIVESMLGRSRNGGNSDTLPKIELASASEFLAVIDETGGFDLASEDSALYSSNLNVLDATADAVVGFPNYATPYRDTWTRAIQVFANSRAMRTVIAKSLNEMAANSGSMAEGPESAGHEQAPVVEARRRRAAL